MRVKTGLIILMALTALGQLGCSKPAGATNDFPSIADTETSYDTCIKELTPLHRQNECDNVSAQNSMSYNQYAGQNSGRFSGQASSQTRYSCSNGTAYCGTSTGYSTPVQYPYVGYNGSTNIGYSNSTYSNYMKTLPPEALQEMKTQWENLAISSLNSK
jgi:hypothetical protein